MTFFRSLWCEMLKTSLFLGPALCEGGAHLLTYFPNLLWSQIPVPTAESTAGSELRYSDIEPVSLSVLDPTALTIRSHRKCGWEVLTTPCPTMKSENVSFLGEKRETGFFLDRFISEYNLYWNQERERAWRNLKRKYQSVQQSGCQKKSVILLVKIQAGN